MGKKNDSNSTMENAIHEAYLDVLATLDVKEGRKVADIEQAYLTRKHLKNFADLPEAEQELLLDVCIAYQNRD